MKPKQQRYDEACERNVKNSLSTAKYAALKELDKVKHALGIRANDTKYDTQITKRLALAE